ncbi:MULTISPECIES: winged helix-turn-helix domain-containing protein [unclassified Streptomyces]|uniref:ArsR/SmtB family transcription factor n=1 Tax=unclassified Streptomyces TaxID=2593676 RepID=UPI002474F9B6|nr:MULTISPECIES: winged helix-turn-helix domain-containing protein [unclassified Streptomyces]MDH6448794.1 DNA-binding transcriptional ArsR family regulator [Streptomyces sp. SAI-119]MDH6500625.1 DNA-binding transcriptional ArsR family regulator [Streptomyces sp. SAI-149]
MLDAMTEDPQAPQLARLAALIADETRAACLLALLDGRAWTAGELARRAGVAASTLSEHLDKLVAGGLLTQERQGRHRYVRLADARVAHLVEDLAAQVSPNTVQHLRNLRESSAGSAMARGRTCYDHLAGRLGIAVTDALTSRRLLRQDTGFALTDAGLAWFEAAGISLDRKGRRPLARACLDWTERRPHLAGVAGAALCRHALAEGWCVRIGSERAVKVTQAGSLALSELLGIDADTLR